MKSEMKKKALRNNLLVFASVVLLTAAPSFAQMGGAQSGGSAGAQSSPAPQQQSPGMAGNSQMQQQGQDSSTSQMEDKAFVKDALQGGMTEVQLGQLAQQKGSSDDVKQYGAMMVADHTKLGDEMKPIAQQLGVKPPDGPSKKDKQLMDKLQGMSGTDFDNAYIAAMVKDHKKDSNDFKSELQQTQNPQLKQLANQGSQVIDQHLAKIEQIAQSHNLNGDGKPASGQ